MLISRCPPIHAGRLCLPVVLVGVLLGTLACSADAPREGRESTQHHPARYLYVFAGHTGAMGAAGHAHTTAPDSTQPSDFVAVIDADSSHDTYGQIIRVMPTGDRASMPHHTEMVMPDSGWPFAANAFLASTTYLVDVSNPRVPMLAGRLDVVPGLRLPHSFARLPNGDLLGTYQFGDGRIPGDPGGIARFSRTGKLLQSSSAADPAFAGQALRTYSLDVSPASDLVLTTSVAMDPTDTTSADVVKLWRLSDLRLLRTLPLPRSVKDSSSRYPFELRFLSDGRSALLNTYYCGFYLLSGLDGDSPSVSPVLSLSHPQHIGCTVPLLIDRWWIMPVASTREYHVYDVSNPKSPRRVAVLASDSNFEPHWIARDPGSDRLVMTAEGPSPAVRLAHFDTATGQLRWDLRFRERADGALGVSFDRREWPGGTVGRAAPHGAIFSRR